MSDQLTTHRANSSALQHSEELLGRHQSPPKPAANAAVAMSKTVVRAVERWWKIALPIGVVLAAIAGTVVWITFVPSYTSFAVLHIKHDPPSIVSPTRSYSSVFIATQLKYFTTRAVLGPAQEKIASRIDLSRVEDPIAWLQRKIQVYPLANSELVRVAFSDPDPQDAMQIVDAVVAAYMDFHRNYGNDRSVKLIDLLERELLSRNDVIRELREDVLQKYKALAADGFITTSEALPFDSINQESELENAPIAELQNALIDTSVTLKLLETRLRVTEELGKPETAISQARIDASVETLPSVQELRSQIEETRAALVDLESTTKNFETRDRYLRLKQDLVASEESLKKLRERLREDTQERLKLNDQLDYDNIIRDLKSEIHAKTVTREYLQKQVDEALRGRGTSGEQMLAFESARARLEREDKIYEHIAQRISELKTERNAPAQVELIDSAVAPAMPDEALPWKKLAAVICGALALPFGIAVLWERSVQRVDDVEAFRSATSLNIVGEIAALPKSMSGGEDQSRRKLSLFEESIDSLRTGLRLSKSLSEMRVLAIVSAVSQEGKTSLASQLAISMARASREPVLLIDADIRAPDINDIFEISNDVGLADVLGGEYKPSDAIHVDYSPRLHLMPAGQLKMHPHELIGECGLREILDELKQNYRYIIIDTPPVLSCSEALVFATHADASLICARRGYSRVRQVREAYDRLVRAEANPVGVVINGVPVTRYAYAYGQYRYRYNYSY